MFYVEIRVRAQLDPHWTEWFDGLTLTPCEQKNLTTLSGHMPDQAALYGVLWRLRNLRIPLLSVWCSEGTA